MTLIDDLGLKRNYEATLFCDNCNQRNEIRIPKGTRIQEYIDYEKAKCPNCGCVMAWLSESKVTKNKEIDKEVK